MFGAGLLVGTALIVIIPEGIESLYSISELWTLLKSILLAYNGLIASLIIIIITIITVYNNVYRIGCGFGFQPTLILSATKGLVVLILFYGFIS